MRAGQLGEILRDMQVPAKKLLVLAALCVAASSAWADEIKLKDGKKLYGVIVGFEDNMFRVKTDFGFVLVEKEKIAAIVPIAPGEKAPQASTANDAPKDAARSARGEGVEAQNKARISNAPVRPSLPAVSGVGKVTPPAIKPDGASPSGMIATAPPPAPPKEPELPPNREEVQGNLYTNYSHGFKMYKAPSWELIEDARQALPNAIVAMGTANESTLMVVGQEKAKDSLTSSASGVERRLREIYSNYRLISQRDTAIGGSAAVEYKFRGTAEEHDWSGTLVVVGRGKEVLTLLGMTYADSDLIQIQENVIARAIASTSFDVGKITAEK